MKTYRLYFNREKDWPQCWSIDEGTQATEINVCGVRLSGVRAEARLRPQGDVAKEDQEKVPAAWLEVEAEGLVLTEGVAHFIGSTQ